MPYLAFWLQTAASPNLLVQFLPLVVMGAIIYLLIIMPAQKQKKVQAAMLASLVSGNEVITTGGIVGTVVSVAPDNLVIRVKPDNIKLLIARSAVTTVVNPDKALEEKK